MPACRNPECGQTQAIYQGYCEPCYRLVRRHGWRPCQFCGRPLLRNQAPTCLSRLRIVSCHSCHAERSTWWHYLYPQCRNCRSVDRPHQGRGLCDPCHTAYKRYGIRTCSYCGGETIRNHGDQTRYQRHIVCCASCATKQLPVPWSGDYPACRGCGTTAIPHASLGYCGACRQAAVTYQTERQCEICAAATLRSYAKFPRCLCLACFRIELRQVFDAYTLGRKADPTAQPLVINRKVVIRCFDYFNDRQASRLRLTAHDQVGDYLADFHRQLHTVRVETTWERWERLYWLGLGGDITAWPQIIEEGRGLVQKLAKSFFLAWGDREDLIQEGLIGLWQGLRDWQPAKGPLYQFLKLAIRRQLITAIKTANRLKHQSLTRSASLFAPTSGGEDGRQLLEQLVGNESTELAALGNLVGSDAVTRAQHKLTQLRSRLTAGSLNARVLDDLMAYPPWHGEVLSDDRQRRLAIERRSLDNSIQRIRRRAQQLGLRTGELLKDTRTGRLATN